MPLLLAGIMGACGTITYTSKKTTFAPDKVELRLTISDLNYLGESEITLTYNNYLFGTISSLETINGVAYNPSNVKKTRIEGVNSNLLLDKYVDKALYKVIEEYPNATYYQVVYNQKVVDRLFLGSNVKQTIRIKAYSLK
jgi:hypothetical protein